MGKLWEESAVQSPHPKLSLALLFGACFIIFSDTPWAPRFDLLTRTITQKPKKDNSWVNADCFRPIAHPILGNNHTINSTDRKIVNVGWPKCGSSTLKAFLDSSTAINVSHFWPCGGTSTYGKPLTCSNCIQQSILRGLPPLATCGNFVAYTQLDFITPHLPPHPNAENGTCIFPQISYLNEIYNEAPEAIFLLTFRNVTAWIKSMASFNRLRKRLSSFCEFPEYNFTRGMGMKDEEMEDLYCRHVKHIRQFVSERPSLSLVEYSIDGEDVGHYLSSVIPLLNGSNYGHENARLTKKKGEG